MSLGVRVSSRLFRVGGGDFRVQNKAAFRQDASRTVHQKPNCKVFSMPLPATWIAKRSSSCRGRGNHNIDRNTCHEHVLISGDKKVEQVRIAHAVHRGNDQLAELKLRIVSGGDSAKEVASKTKTSGQLLSIKRSDIQTLGDSRHFQGKGHVLLSDRRAGTSQNCVDCSRAVRHEKHPHGALSSLPLISGSLTCMA